MFVFMELDSIRLLEHAKIRVGKTHDNFLDRLHDSGDLAREWVFERNWQHSESDLRVHFALLFRVVRSCRCCCWRAWILSERSVVEFNSSSIQVLCFPEVVNQSTFSRF